MEIALQLIYSVGLLFLMMIPGIILKKFNLVGDGFGKGLSNLVLYIAQPALVFSAYIRDFDREIFKTAVLVLIFSALAHGFFAAVAFMCFRKNTENTKRILRFALIFSNAAYMGMPLLESALGKDTVIYASIYNITFNLFIWSLGVRICQGEKGEPVSKNIMKAIVHPVTIAAALGIIVFVLPINSYLPEIVVNGVTMLKNLVAPLSMIVIGLRLAEIDLPSLKQTFFDKSLYLYLALRHFLLPVAVFGAMKGLNLILPIGDTAITVMLILSSTPAATATTMFAEKYNCDPAYASRIVTVSTLFSIVSMPLVILLTAL